MKLLRAKTIVALSFLIASGYIYVTIPEIWGEKFLILTPRGGGFNNQLITVYDSILCASKLNRTVILPLMYEDVRKDTLNHAHGPYPFEDYFRIDSLQEIGRFRTFRQFKSEGFPCRKVGYNSRSYYGEKKRLTPLLQGIYPRRGWRFSKKLFTDLDSANNQKCIDDSLCRKNYEFGYYSNYSEGQGYNIKNSLKLQEIRKAMEPSDTVQTISNNYVKSITGKFNSLHIRRGDYETKCKEMQTQCNEYGENAFVQSGSYILESLKRFRNPNLPIFISTTHSDTCREFFKGTNFSVRFMDDLPLPKGLEWAEKRKDILSFSSQVIASHAEEFIGNRFSSYTSSINYMRFIRNNSEEFNFF